MEPIISSIKQHHTHRYGFCLSWDNPDLMYVPLPKSASTWTEGVLSKSLGNPNKMNFHDSKLYRRHSIVVLRDPVESWVAGIAEFLSRNCGNYQLTNEETIDLIFKQVTFDEHTDNSVNFLSGLHVDRCTFFKFDQDYTANIKHYIENYLGCVFVDSNVHNEKSATSAKFAGIIQDRLNNNTSYRKQIEDYYKKDQQLMDQIKFYVAR